MTPADRTNSTRRRSAGRRRLLWLLTRPWILSAATVLELLPPGRDARQARRQPGIKISRTPPSSSLPDQSERRTGRLPPPPPLPSVLPFCSYSSAFCSTPSSITPTFCPLHAELPSHCERRSTAFNITRLADTNPRCSSSPTAPGQVRSVWSVLKSDLSRKNCAEWRNGSLAPGCRETASF